jgi:membrane-bound ClpP family serine protease
LKLRKRSIKVGGEELIGQVTKADTEITEEKGTIKIHGEIWNARTQAGEIEEGEKVEIVAREGLTLFVKRKE